MSERALDLTDVERAIVKIRCEDDLLFFTRYFFRVRQNAKFRVNWHHELIARELEKVMAGETENLVINIPPGGSKTEIAVINFIARGLALNPRSRFLHLSYSDDLASLNSQAARDLVTSQEFQELWPLKIAEDTKSKKRWNILQNKKAAGGVYATSIAGQITGFRAGHMVDGFQGAIIIDDPLKPEDAFSRSKINAANRRLVTTIKSRKANPKTPIIIIMQRLAENDPVGFIQGGNVPGNWKHVVIPALLTEEYVKTHFPEYSGHFDLEDKDDKERFSYWPYKEPLKDLLELEEGKGSDATGGKVSRYVFASQYNQSPQSMGGNIIKGEMFSRYSVLPKILYRKIFADTAQKTKEKHDFSVFECWGMGADSRIYLLDLIRGKWEAPELQKRAISFWSKHKAADVDKMGALREMVVEDKASGTGLIQTIRLMNSIPIKAVQRNTDKLMRVYDALPYIDLGSCVIPEDAPWVEDFVSENESFNADMTHDHDDQIDPMLDAVDDMLSTGNKIETWKRLAQKGK